MAAVLGAMVAVSATTLMGLTGIASASVPGTCTETVNIRERPSIDSRIVALCEAGTAAQTGPTRDGFVRITDLGGWAVQECISADDAPARPTPTATPADDTTDEDADELRTPRTTDSRPATGAVSTSDDDDREYATDDVEDSTDEEADEPRGLGGPLG